MQRLHWAKVGLPNQLALDAEAVQPKRAKEGEEMLAVGRRRIGCQAARLMTLLVRQRLPQRFLPEDFSARAVDRQGHEPVAMGDGEVVVIAWRRAGAWRQRITKCDGRGEEHAIAPDDRSGMAAAGDI